jgi:hypothetical protein
MFSESGVLWQNKYTIHEGKLEKVFLSNGLVLLTLLSFLSLLFGIVNSVYSISEVLVKILHAHVGHLTQPKVHT